MKDDNLHKWLKAASGSIIAVIGVITTIIGAVRLYRANYGLFIFVLVIVLIGAGWVAGTYVIFAPQDSQGKGSKHPYKYPIGRRWAITGIVASAIGLLVMAQFPGVRAFSREAFIGTSTPSPTLIPTPTPTITPTPTPVPPLGIKPSISSLLHATTVDGHQLALTILNPYDFEVLVTHITIQAQANWCRLGFSLTDNNYNYTILDNIRIQSGNQPVTSFVAGVQPQSGALQDAIIPAQGTMSSGNLGYNLQLGFDVITALAPKENTMLTITLPAKLRPETGDPILLNMPDDPYTEQQTEKTTPEPFVEGYWLTIEATINNPQIILPYTIVWIFDCTSK